MEIKVLTLQGQESLLDSLPINSKFKDINFQKRTKGIELFQTNKKDLIMNVRDEWLRINHHKN